MLIKTSVNLTKSIKFTIIMFCITLEVIWQHRKNKKVLEPQTFQTVERKTSFIFVAFRLCCFSSAMSVTWQSMSEIPSKPIKSVIKRWSVIWFSQIWGIGLGVEFHCYAMTSHNCEIDSCSLTERAWLAWLWRLLVQLDRKIEWGFFTSLTSNSKIIFVISREIALQI